MTRTGLGLCHATGKHFVMAAGCPEAVRVGQAIVRQGGNLVDAAVAATAAACVAMPHMTGLGGELFALVAMRGQPVIAINASGAAPQRADIRTYRDLGYARVPSVGGLAAQTPCTPFGLETLHQTGGCLPFAAVMQPAIRLAQKGILVRARLANMIAARQADLRNMRVWQETFCPGGIPLAVGSRLLQPNLARALRTLSDHGATGFATSWVGQDMAESVRSCGGLMTHDDIRAAYAELVPALACHYKDVEVFTQPPVSQGFVLLRALGLLARKNGDEGCLWVRATRALQQALAERIKYLRDDGLSRHMAEQLIRQAPEPLMPCQAVIANPGGNTTAMSMMDSHGNALAVIHSVYDDFGSGVMGEKSGILLNNRLSAFFLDTAYANALAPRRRSMHTLHTFIVKDQNGVRWAGGSPGADHQPQANLHVLLHLLDGQMNPAQAVSQPRWVVFPGTSPAEVLNASEPYVAYESGVSDSQLQALRDAGYPIRALGVRAIGSSKLVGHTPEGTLGAWVDTRREGAVGSL